MACDNFQRLPLLGTLLGGWGSADVGGPWSQFILTPKFWISSDTGYIAADSSAPSNVLSVNTQDVDMRALISPGAISTRYADNGITVRYGSRTNSWYQVTAYYSTTNNNGNYTVQLKRKPDNLLIRPDYQTTIPGGTPYWLRLQARGVNPTILSWKIWANGSAEPATWNDIGTDSNSPQQIAGGVGVIAYVNSGTANVGFNSVLATGVNTAPQIVPCPSGLTACDSYNRTTAGAWGTADVGGAWSGTGPPFSVTPGNGSIVADSTTPSTFLGSVSMQDTDVRALITPPPVNSSQYVSDGVAVRYVASTGSWYQLTTYDNTQSNGGNYVVQLTRKPDNVALRPDYSTSLAGGLPYWIRVQAQGTAPTTLRWRIWLNGTAEPTTWNDSAIDNTAAEQGPGGIGAVAYTATGTSTIRYNSIQASVPPPTPPRIIACPASPLACDSFNRSTSGGWGTADVGGAWSASGTQYNVTPGNGTIVADSTTPSNFLPSVSAQDVDMLTLISPPPSSGSTFVSDGVAVRYASAAGTWYQVAAYFNPSNNNGNYTVQLVRKPDNTSIRPDYQTNVPGGAPYWLRIEAQGVSPTTLRWKLWPDGSTEPRAWTDAGIDSNAAQQVAGGAGVLAYQSSGSGVVAFNSVQLTALTATAATIVPCPTSVVACDSFNRTVSNSWGVADLGGSWNTSGAPYSVTPGSGMIVADSTTPSNFFNSVSVQDVDALALISPPLIDSSQYQDDGVAVRYVAASGTWYQVNAFYNSGNNGGNYSVQLKRKPDGTLLRPVYNSSLPGGTPYWMRLEAQGVNPTTLRWKMWSQGAAEPSAWNDTATDSTAAEQTAGSAGVVAYTSTGTGAVQFGSVQVSNIASTPPPPPPSTTCPTSPIACDTYSRTVSNGWGSADTGGAWQINGTPSNWSVSAGSGRVTVAASGTELADLSSTAAQDVELLQKVVLPRSTQASNDTAYVLARYVGGSSPTYYRVGVGQGTGGSQVIIRTQRADGTNVTADVNSGIAASDGAVVWLRVQVQGTYPTSIRARAWADGSAEPSGWTVDATDSTAAMQASGAVGVRDRNEDGSASHSFQHESFQAVAMAGRSLTCAAGQVACDTFQRSVSNGWGTADVGGAWNKTGSIYSVTRGEGLIQVDSSAPQNFLPSVSIQDVDARLLLSMPSLGATGDGGIAIRYGAAGGTYYQVSVYYPSGVDGSNYVVQLKRKPENVLINPDFSTSIPGGTAVWIRVQAQGVSPTTLRWKIWQDGTPEPAGWTATGTDSNAAEQGPGGVGVEGFSSSGTANVGFNYLSAGAIGP